MGSHLFQSILYNVIVSQSLEFTFILWNQRNLHLSRFCSKVSSLLIKVRFSQFCNIHEMGHSIIQPQFIITRAVSWRRYHFWRKFCDDNVLQSCVTGVIWWLSFQSDWVRFDRYIVWLDCFDFQLLLRSKLQSLQLQHLPFWMKI